MREFIWGLDKEANIYCASGKIALMSDPQVPSLTREIAQESQFQELILLETDAQVRIITEWTRQIVTQQGDLSEDNVAWMIALFSKSYEIAGGAESFDYVFKAVFKMYYTLYE